MERFQDMIGNLLMYHVIIAAIIVVAAYMLTRVAKAILRFICQKIIAKTETDLDDRILAVVLAHVKTAMIVVGFRVAVTEIRKGITANDIGFAQVLDYSASILYVVLVVLAFKILSGVLSEVINWYLDKMTAAGAENLKVTLGPLTRKALSIVVGLIAVIIILDHFGINIGSLLVSLGVGSLAVALAAQDTLANMIAGFVILVDRPFRVGDRIELDGGQVGDVQEIGLRSTKLLNFDNNLIIIPNADLVKGKIINHAYPFHQTRLVLNVGVAYGTDPAKVRRILLDLAAHHPDVLSDPAPEVLFTAMSDSSIEFSLRARVSDFTKGFVAQALLREQAYLAFAREGIEIPFPQRVVHMKSDS